MRWQTIESLQKLRFLQVAVVFQPAKPRRGLKHKIPIVWHWSMCYNQTLEAIPSKHELFSNISVKEKNNWKLKK